jgi:hypothetical protein
MFPWQLTTRTSWPQKSTRILLYAPKIIQKTKKQNSLLVFRLCLVRIESNGKCGKDKAEKENGGGSTFSPRPTIFFPSNLGRKTTWKITFHFFILLLYNKDINNNLLSIFFFFFFILSTKHIGWKTQSFYIFPVFSIECY